MIMRSRIGLLIIVVVVGCVIGRAFSETTVMPASPEKEKPLANAAIQECRESAPSVFIPVLLTLIVVCVVMLIIFIFWKYYWKIKHGKHLVLVTDVEKGEPEYAFDNPGFREGSPASQTRKSVDVKEKVSHKESNNLSQQQQLSNGHKPQSLDESAPNKTSADTKTNVIPLKSRDFTGLGFNICGNMRDGIYVKDLLHHGPASETGRIKAGDRISAIRINFSHMVYEDAMAILSYASPYEVEIEVEDSSVSPDSLKNTSLNNHIAHSFYRSQSFSTAQHIQKIIPRKLNFNASAVKHNSQSEPSKAAVLQVTEVSDKMCKFGGIKVLPDIKCESSTTIKVLPLQQSEKQQNTTVVNIECDSGIETKTPTMFDEVDLSGQSSANEKVTSSLTSTFKDHNVKKTLAKGIQNLKEKLNNHIHKSCDKASHKEFTVETKAAVEQSCPVDESDPGTGFSRSPSNSESDYGDEMAKKISKRKAPLPPAVRASESSDKPSSDFNLLNEIENEVYKNNTYECKDDSENEDETANNTIELNSSHITVHHVPEESNRKAASLGDLSKITDKDASLVPLERAVSLELAEHTPRGSKKSQAPKPPEESPEEALFKEPKMESALNSKLKKSSLFGTLEEAMKPSTSDDSDCDQILTSTPMKLTDEMLPNVESVGNISWDLSFEVLNDSKDEDVFLEDEKVPDLPNSPMPDGPTFVTEIKVSNDDGDDISHVNSSDLTLFMTAAEISTSELENHIGESSLASVQRRSPIMNHDKAETNGTESEDSKDSSIDTVKEATCNGTTEESKTELVIEVKNTGLVSSSKLKFSKENMSDEQILALNSSLTHQPTPRYRATNNETFSATNKKKSPNSMTKLPKLGQSISPVRAVGSRIPVRANTEPSLKVSLINNNNKDDTISKTRKYKITEEPIENGKVTFTPTSHLPSAVHKTSVLSENRHNGPNR